MAQGKSNISYACKKCGVKGTLVSGVSSFNFKKLDKLPCGCLAKNGKFAFLRSF